jgi:hypothetical protein
MQLKFSSVKVSSKIRSSLITLLLIFFSLFSINSCYAVAVGDSYGGGTVFCVSKTADITTCVPEGTGDYGLIMANEDQVNFDSNPQHGVTWSSAYKAIGVSAQSLDDGATNTAAILAAHLGDNSGNNAAHLCRSYKDPIEGHTDWYLPSKNELNKMYVYAKAHNLIGKGCSGDRANGVVRCLVGGYDDPNKIYWSSSECSGGASGDAWFQGFSSGDRGYLNKVLGRFAVRAIRAFNPSTIEQLNKLFVNLNLPKSPQKVENEEEKEDKKTEENKFVKKIEDEEKVVAVVAKGKSAKSLLIPETMPLIPWDEITLISKLGEGGFGIVYKGTWKHGGEVAIKQIKSILEEDAELELKNESSVMAKLNSPYIIRLFGLCWDENKYALVMELMPNASLSQLLRSGKELPWDIRYSIARDVAYGLRFLHDRKILHRDLKSANVLLDGNLRAKLSDFGLSKVKTQTAYISTNSWGGTVAWMAPELFSLKPKYSATSDVYAYGMTAWELASRERPYEGVNNDIVISEVKNGNREEIPTDCPKEFAELIEKCWSQNPSERPTMEMVVKGLESLLPKK